MGAERRPSRRRAALVALVGLAAAAVGLVAGPGATGAGATPAASSARFAIPAAADQLVVVSSPSYDPPGYLATFQTFQRANAFSPWEPVFATWQAETGWGHLRDVRREGDGSTPTGVYGFGPTMYGNDPDPSGLHEPYHQLVCGDWWDEDPYSPQYNRFVHVACGTTPPFASWSEALWTETEAYPYFAVVDFNADPIVGGADAPGSGIFLHNWVGGPTAGCVALPLADLLEVLRWLEPARHPVIEIGTDAEVGAVPPAAPPVAYAVARSSAHGYWMASSAGTVTAFGDAGHFSSPDASGVELAAPVTAVAPEPDGAGYLVATADGQVFNYGRAHFYGSPFHDGHHLDLVAIAATRNGGGYLVATADGRVLAFGDARWHGSPRNAGGRVTVAGLAVTPGGGYDVLTTGGAVWPFGAARSHGSPSSQHRHPTGRYVGLVVDRSGNGYWVATSTGQVFNFGGAGDDGSLAGTRPGDPVVAITGYLGGYALYTAPPSLPAHPVATTFTSKSAGRAEGRAPG